MSEHGPAAHQHDQSRRPASVTLRGERQDGSDLGSLMDPATQSLADALRITYRLVQLAMLVLVGVYVLSGFESVNEGERGIRLLFGKVQEENLGPGFRFSLPAPFGELEKVQVSPAPIEVNAAFWPHMTEQERVRPIQELAGGGSDSLDPEADHYVLTADGAIAHTQWQVTYTRSDPAQYARAVWPDHERQIVLSAVYRGVVHAAAGLTIDELLKSAPDSGREGAFRTAEDVAREVAQATLDAEESGLTIKSLVLTQKIPPRRVIPDFSRVQASESEANQAREKAEADRRAQLTSAAGGAAEMTLAAIRTYEERLERGEEEAAAATLDLINSILLGEPVEIDGRPVRPDVYGEVTDVVNGARQYRDSVAARAQGQLLLYQAKLEQFRVNPLVVVAVDWTGALESFLGRDGVEVQLLPPGMRRFVVQYNRDEALMRELAAERNQREQQELQARRQKEFQEGRFQQNVTRERVHE